MSTVPVLVMLLIIFVLSALLAVAIPLTIIFTVRKRNRQRRQNSSKSEVIIIQKSLGEVLKAHRTECKMTQEFVADYMGVSRQTVSKWETGVNEPSTSNLLQLAKLFGVPAETLLSEISF